MSRPALRRLAERVGILPGYVGTDGLYHQAPERTQIALLAALGFEASDEASAERALARLDAEEPLLPATAVLEQGQAYVLLPHVPDEADECRLEEVAVCLEDGRTLAVGAVLDPAGGGRRLAVQELPLGVHELRLVLPRSGRRVEARQKLVIVPPACLRYEDVAGRRRLFGIWANLYSVRSRSDLGIGGLGALRELIAFAAGSGASFVGINPLHAQRNRFPEICPYSGTSRILRNPLYIDVKRVPELSASEEARRLLDSEAVRREIGALRAAERIDYDRVAALQRSILEPLFETFRKLHLGAGSARGRAFEAFCGRDDGLVRDYATFQALEDKLAARGCSRDWHDWPHDLRSPLSPAVADFRRTQAAAVGFHAYLQFELDRQLAEAAGEARSAGLPVGLYLDLAAGASAAGFDAWAFPGSFLEGVQMGAPPDAFQPAGQRWGVRPLAPDRLARDGYRYWRMVLRRAFEHAGALRLDHAMGLERQFWIPDGAPAREGAYVRMPASDLFGLVALESRRSGAFVVAEDLGTVPEGFGGLLERWGILSSRVLIFERREDGSFRDSADFPARSLVTANTHDMPTLAAYRDGRDLSTRDELGVLHGFESLGRALEERAAAHRALVERLRAEGVLGNTVGTDLCRAVYAFLARTAAWLVGVSLDDLAGETEPVNLPGLAPDAYPSWTRRMQRSLGDLAGDASVQGILDASMAARRR